MKIMTNRQFERELEKAQREVERAHYEERQRNEQWKKIEAMEHAIGQQADAILRIEQQLRELREREA